MFSAEPTKVGAVPELSDFSQVKVAVFGPGTVGSQVIGLLQEQRQDLSARVGVPVNLAAVYVRDPAVDRPGIASEVLTADPASAIAAADVVVELMGGLEPARTIVLQALAAGKPVVTANKALLASHGPELFEAAEAAGVDLYFEAAVAGAIPLIRPVRESLAGDQIERVLGIVNGTTNYVLDQMTAQGWDYDHAVSTAQALGYAEADPTADVAGHDAAAKAAILASLAFHQRVQLTDVYCEGITEISAADVAAAATAGQVIKLLAIAERTTAGVNARVHPVLLDRSHPLANVRGAFNAVFVEARAAGELMFYGPGAGGLPTASAVLGDLVSVARNLVHGGRGPRESNYGQEPLVPIAETFTRVQLRMLVQDRPGVLAGVAAVFAAHQVSIESVRQHPPASQGETAELIIATHRAQEGALQSTVADLKEDPNVERLLSVIRIEGA